MGPDHAQLEIYGESKHGALFAAQRERFNMAADPKKLTTADMSVPTSRTSRSPFSRRARSSAAVPGAPEAVTTTVVSFT